MIKKLSINGFRGFGEIQTIIFSLPDGKREGSGLNIITGANNSGKTTIIESIRAFNNSQNPTFSEGKRNLKTESRVELKIIDENDNEYTIRTVDSGGSSTEKNSDFSFKSYIVQSRRAINYEFSKATTSRDHYVSEALGIESQRSATLNNFTYRIFQIENDKEKFDRVLCRILGQNFKWTIEQRDSGNYYIKYISNGVAHSSEGIGDGVWSVFTICAALYDAPPKSTVVIDEPELSIHPSLQKKLRDLLIEYSRDIQVIISTHSPYFISWVAISQGAGLIRVVKEHENTKCYYLKNDCRNNISGIIKDINNPHVLGISANEIFFLEDRIVLVEGQEDVVIYKKIASDIGKSFEGEFFGWGVGGAPKMQIFLSMFKDLGYKKVVAIFDGDKKDEAEELEKQFTKYHFVILKEDDIRDKRKREITAKNGITDEKGNIKLENKDYMTQTIQEINRYFNSTNDTDF